MKDTVLDWLMGEDGFVSGQFISRKLGVTRAAVWKIVKTLQDEGYPIEAVPRRGYRMAATADVLTARQVKNTLRDAGLDVMFSHVTYTPRTDSTNQMAKRAAEEKITGNALFIAAKQEKGRGRRGRSWISDSTEGLWFSLLLRPKLQAGELAAITLFTGLCVAEALGNLDVDVGLKWPNDIVTKNDGRKLGGILTEMMIEENTVEAAIIGIGINVSSKDFPVELNEIATSLYLCGKIIGRLALLKEIVQVFFTRWPDFLQSKTWLKEYVDYSLTLGKQVRVMANGKEVTHGTAVDLDDKGELIVEDSNGQRHIVCSGEVSVRGLMGEK